MGHMGHMREGRSSKCSHFIQDYFWNFKESLKVFKKVSKSCFQNFSHTWYHTCLCRIFVIHGEHKFLGNFQNFRNVTKHYLSIEILSTPNQTPRGVQRESRISENLGMAHASAQLH